MPTAVGVLGVTLALVAGFAPAGATNDDTAGRVGFDQSAYPEKGVDDVAVPPKWARTPYSPPRGARVAPGDPRTQVDVLVVATPEAVAQAGGLPAIVTYAQAEIAKTNSAYANSLVTTRQRLVDVVATPTPESTGVEPDLFAIQKPTDGRFDEVYAQRDRVHADLVHLITRGSASDPYGGIAFSDINPNAGFGVTTLTHSPPLTYAHETGHNFGAGHDAGARETPSQPLPARGLVNVASRWFTIMAYPTACQNAGVTCSVIPYFTNPAVAYNGAPTGTTEANNASVIEANAAAVASYRQSQLYPVAPLISGAVLGRKAKVDTGAWTPAASLAVQWYVDGVAIPGATGKKFKIKRKYVHKSLTVGVTGTAASYAPVGIGSAPVEVSKKLLRKTRTPKIKGKAKKGKRLHVKVKQSRPRSKMKFSWYSNSIKIKGAKGRSYKVKKKDRGTYIQVRVTFKKKGFETVIKPSASKLVK